MTMSNPFSRRQVIQGLSVIGAGSAVGACTDQAEKASPASTTTSVARASVARASGGRSSAAGGVLVLVTLYGGNDALNTVVPIRDPNYAKLRGSLALDPARTHDIGEGFALHPALSRTKALWDGGRAAVVHGVGFKDLDRSHFHCMDVWQAASAEDQGSGWLGRWLDIEGAGPLDAVAVGRHVPLVGRGEHESAAAIPVGPFVLPGGGALSEGLAAQVRRDENRSALESLVARSGADLLKVETTVGPVLGGKEDSGDDGLAASLDTVATLIEADLPTRAFMVETGGFDTHANQAATHEGLLAGVDSAIGGFLDKTGGRPVTVAVYSEFGRRVAPNASGGTDHGQGGCVLLAGSVREGHHGDPPPLDRLDKGDLATTVDFRSVFGGLLEGVLGVEAKDVIDDAPKPLQLA